MKIKFPLYAKILAWFFLNVVFLGAALLVAARFEFNLGLGSLMSGPARERIRALTQVIGGDLRDRPRDEWDGVLKRAGEAYDVQLFLFQNERQLAGTNVTLPAEVRDRLAPPRGMKPPGAGPGPGPGFDGERGPPEFPDRPPGFGPRPPGMEGPPPLEEARQTFILHTSTPNRYWIGARLRLPDPGHPPPHPPATLLAMSESLGAGGLIFDSRELTTWVIGGIAVILISALFWFPLVRGITRSISKITHATESIAEGRFDVRLAEKRKDELGSLGDAINRMAIRLSGFVTGQKRFLGDIAHELCSPLARIQVALGILEQRADEKQKVYLNDLREEVEQMSNLVNELLSFSKASLGGSMIKLRPVLLRTVVEKAVSRECGSGEGVEIKINIEEQLQVIAEPELLLRAVGNVLRNAIRYAAQVGPITLSAAREGKNIVLSVEDCGPGIPVEALAQIFDPFFRVDASRDRETGGVGLGLSIVKTCIQSCAGTVSCENRQPSGLRVVMKLGPVEPV